MNKRRYLTIALALGLTAAARAGTFVPIPLTSDSFNYDVVIEKAAPHSPVAGTATASLDAGLGANGYWNCTFYQQGYNASTPTSGLPAPGSSITANGYTFQLPASYAANNAVLIDSVSTNGTLTLGTAATCSSLGLLVTSGGGAQTINYVVHHANGTTETGVFQSLDWFNSSSVAYLVSGRINLLDWSFQNVSSSGVPALHYTNLTVSAASPVTSIDFAYGGAGNTGHAAVWAVSTSSDGVTYSPVAVTGFNQDMVVEASAPTKPSFTPNAYTTASMDGADSNTGMTWYENGFVPIAPRSGIPGAGTYLTNVSAADHTYLMPPSYTTSDAAMLSPTIASKTLTPATPTNFLALSFLTASGHGNQVIDYIVHHADSTIEVGKFTSPDWWGSPVAWSANGRADATSGGIDNLMNTQPNLCYVDIALTNITSAVTSIDLAWDASNGTANTPCSVVLAVSGGPVPNSPVIIVQPNPTYVAPGATAHFTVTASGDALVYHWQKNGVNLTDGGNISGSATATLSVSSASATDVATYRVVISNGAGTITSRSIDLNLLSTYNQTVLGLNPTAYWPLNETQQPPAPNQAANLGTLGAAANATYVGTYNNNVAGALVGSTDKAAHFDGSSGRAVAAFTPALAAAAPFSVEAWVQPATTRTSDGDVVCPLACGQFSDPRSGWLIYQGQTGWFLRLYNQNGTAFSLNLEAGTAPVLGNWYHLVAVYNGTTASLYVNGVGASGTPTGYVPSAGGPLMIGARSDNGFYFNGAIDEVAYYTNALSASDVTAHYQNGISASPATPYNQLVLAQHPICYYRLDEPVYTAPDANTLPVAGVLGTITSGGQGLYRPGTLPGQPGRAAMGTGNYSCGFNSVVDTAYVDCGNPDQLVSTTSASLMAWVKEAPGDNRFQTIFAKGDANGSWRLQMTGNGVPTFGTRGLDNMDMNGPTAINDGLWHQLVCVYDDGAYSGLPCKKLYVDGSLAASNSVSGTLATSTDPFAIGANTDYGGRTWSGSIDEVAVFIGQALSDGQIQQLYLAAGIAPTITQQPVSPGSVAVGASATMTVAAVGTPTLTYQWTKNGANLSGKTTASLTLNNLQTTDSGSYAVVVANNYGSVTSSVVVLSVEAVPPYIIAQPQPTTRYQGANATFSVTAGGTAPLSYQWNLNGSAIGGATASTYTATGVQSSGNYNCTVSNPYGFTNSANAALTVIPLAAGSYGAVVVADNPAAFWRLGEANGTVAADYMNGHNGQYTNVMLGVPGYSVLDANTAVRVGPGINSYVGGIQGIDYSTGIPSFTVEAWVKGPATQMGDVAIVARGNGGGGEQFDLDTGNGGKYRFAVRDASGNWFGADASVGPDGTWQHVVGVCDQINRQTTVYVNGQVVGSATPPNGQLLASTHPISIGARQSGNGAYDNNFDGFIDEVAIYNYPLNIAQVQTHYNARYGFTTPPVIRTQPAAVSQYAGVPVTFSVEAGGSDYINYTWRSNGVDVLNTVSNTFTVGPVTASMAADYSVVVANGLGSVTSAVAHLTVLNPPTALDLSSALVLHLRFDNDYLDHSGRGNNGTNAGATTFVPGKVGSSALHYSSDGTSFNYVKLGLRPDLQFTNNVDFTVAYWVRLPYAAAPFDLPFLCNARNSTFSTGYTFAPGWQNGGWAWSLNGLGVYGANASINDGNWHHLAHTFDRHGYAVTYLDGAEVDIRPIADRVGDSDVYTGQPTNIGQDPTGTYANSTDSAQADMDDMGIWRRVLSAEEVAAMYAAGNSNGASFAADPILLSIQKVSGTLQVIWSGGTLQSADQVKGPYTDVTGATSPYTVPGGPSQKFYRVRR